MRQEDSHRLTEQSALMIVSHRYRFIFLRTEKTGGTSLAMALQNLLDENDLQAEMHRPPWAKFVPIHHGALKRHFPQWFDLHPHATASQIRDVVGRKIFDSYYKFAIERNPWDRQVSLYAHREWKKGKPADHFDRDMRSLIYRNTEYVRLNNWSIYAIGREIVADRVMRYERLPEAIDELVTTLGIPGPLDMPRLRSYTTDRPHYSSYYSDTTRDLVARWYAKEIEALGYEFETEESTAQRASAAVLVDKNTKVVCQGIAGAQGMFDMAAIAYGSRTVGGVPPG
jgi:hypothetical protein